MSTFQLDTATSRANPTPQPMRRLTVPAIKGRKADGATPIVLMGYYNPIHAYGTARFAHDVAAAGVDGLIVVDLPVEEDEVLRVPARAQGVDVIRFVTPTTDNARLKRVLDGAGGYLYYVSVAGVTGTKSAPEDAVRAAMARIRAATDLPCTVGFGISRADQAAAVGRLADGIVVGTAIVKAAGQSVEAAGALVAELRRGLDAM